MYPASFKEFNISVIFKLAIVASISNNLSFKVLNTVPSAFVLASTTSKSVCPSSPRIALKLDSSLFCFVFNEVVFSFIASIESAILSLTSIPKYASLICCTNSCILR